MYQQRLENKAESPLWRYYYDLSTPLTSNTIIYPGDPMFQKKQIAFLNRPPENSHFNLSQVTFGNHTGTHIDFPAHVIEGGKTSSDYSLERLIGLGVIINVPEYMESITADFINIQKDIRKDAIVFFRTKNSRLLAKRGEISKKFVYIEPEAAEILVKKKVRIVGIDYISVDAYSAETLPVHNILLANDVLIIENLELKLTGIFRGNHMHAQFFIIPLNVPNMDGLPVRAMMCKE